MAKKWIEVFVPGRLCIVGEHSDWAAKYKSVNKNINKGYAIVTGIEEGIYAKATTSNKLIVKNLITKNSFECDMNYSKLKEFAKDGGYWSYVAGVSACIKKKFNVDGVEIIINKANLPVKKGLSSSAAICILVTRAFNELYNLNLSISDVMDIAYLGERITPSKCGRLDQACAYGKKPILMTFNGSKLEVKEIKVKNTLYFVFADLMAGKDTVKILKDLNNAYPFPKTEIDRKVHEALGVDNEKIVLECVKYIETGDVKKFGETMNNAQKNFDYKVSPASIEQLKSPILHKVLNDKYIKSLSYGGKGVGSQGDGSVQILAKDYKSQQLIKDYFKTKLKMDAYTLTIEPTEKEKLVKKAIIPVAGNGTRMFPITKCVKKAFLPIIDIDGIIKPVILSLIEELADAGIEEICLIIDKQDQPIYNKLFKKKLTNEMLSKLSPELLEYELKIKKIGKKIKYVYQKEKLGLGHAVSLCESFTNREPVLLVLGDQLYKSNTNISCTKQFLESYNDVNKLFVSAYEIPKKDVFKYGILCGTIKEDRNYFNVDKMIEKPNIDDAEQKYYTKSNGKKKYYAVFGEYILIPEVFEILKRNIKNNKKENGEFQITSVLDEVRSENGMIAFIPNGKMFDVGNTESYKNAFIEKCQK